MKKRIALLAALVLAVLCTVSLAEEAAVNPEALKLYSSEWADGFTDVKIYAEEDQWRVRIVSADGSLEWDYGCKYDEEQKTLVSLEGTDNLKTEIRIDEEGSEIERKEVYKDGKAVFSLNEDGKLIWKDEKEDAGADFAFEKIGWFQGVWIAGESLDSRYELYCYWDVEEAAEGEVYSGYKVEIERYEGEAYTHWVYSCDYDAETDTLRSIFGSKEFAEKEGDAIVPVYDDGKAEFSFDDEGFITWKDEIENAGEGLQFNATNG